MAACSRLRTSCALALLLLLLSLAFRSACPRTVVVDGVAQSQVPALRAGDSVVFKEMDGYDLYMFRSKRAFALCMFAQASLLHSSRGNPSSYFTWHPSSQGSYYFSYKNGYGSLDACDSIKRVEMTVVPASALAPTLSPLPAPPPTAGDEAGDFFPSVPHARRSTSPRPSPGASLPLPGNGRSPSAAAPSAFPGPGNGIPFISSNPALPLPSGEADSATSRPLPVTGGAGQPAQVAGTGLGIQMAALLSLAVPFALWGI